MASAWEIYRSLNSRFVNASLGVMRAVGLAVPVPIPLPIPNPTPNLAAGFTAKAQQIWPGALVAARSSNGILHQHPQEPGRFILDALPRDVPLHYSTDQEVDITWQTSSGGWTHENLTNTFNGFVNGETGAYQLVGNAESVRLDIDSLLWVNELEQTQIFPMLALVPNLLGEFMVWPALWGVGTNLSVEVQPGRLAKKLELSELLALPLPILLGTISLSFKLKLTRSAGVRLWINGSQWNETGTRTTSNPVEFRRVSDGTVLWVFKPPRAYDAGTSQQDGTLRFSQSGGELFVEMRIPYSWLQSATYPVTFDPTLDVGVGASNCDASERDDGTSFSTTAANMVGDSNTAAASRGNWGACFTLTGPTSGDTVDVAYVTFHCQNTTGDDPNTTLYFNDVDDAANFTDEADVTSRVLTTASVDYTATAVGTGAVNTPSLVTPLQEVFDRAGFASGNDVAVLSKGKSDANFVWRVISYDSSTVNCPQIHVEYTAAAPPASGSVLRHRYYGFTLQGARLGGF